MFDHLVSEIVTYQATLKFLEILTVWSLFIALNIAFFDWG